MRRALDGVEIAVPAVGGRAPRPRLAAPQRGRRRRGGRRRALVYTSFVGAAPDCAFTFGRDHFHTEEHIQRLRASATRSCATRCTSTTCRSSPPPRASSSGPAGDGRVAAVARDDIADVAVAALLDPQHEGRTYEVTGREALTLAEAAEILTRHTGREVRYVEETIEEARASRAPSGAPDWEIEGWVTTYAAVAAGELDVVTDTVLRVSRPTSR